MKRKELLSGAVVTVFVFTSAFIATRPKSALADGSLMPMSGPSTYTGFTGSDTTAIPDPSTVMAGGLKNTGGCGNPDDSNNCPDDPQSCKDKYKPAGGTCVYYKTDDGKMWGCACTKLNSITPSDVPITGPSDTDPMPTPSDVIQ